MRLQATDVGSQRVSRTSVMAWAVVFATAARIDATVAQARDVGSVRAVAAARVGRQAAPACFVENRGQWPNWIRFATVRGGLRVIGTDDGLLLGPARGSDTTEASEFVELRLGEATAPRSVCGREPTPGEFEFLLGPTERHTRGAHGFGALAWSAPGSLTSSAAGSAEFVCTLGGAGQSLQIRGRPNELSVRGATVRLDVGNNQAVISAPWGELRFAPSAPSVPSTVKSKRPCSLSVVETAIQFGGVGLPGSSPALLDADLSWSALMGGTAEDIAYQVALDSADRIVVGGYTWSLDFPSTPGSLAYTANQDGFVTKVDPVLDQHVFTAFFGGHGYDDIRGMALVENDRIAIAGSTSSGDLPVTAGVYDSTYNGNIDGYYAKLRSDGTSVLVSTFIGGTNEDHFTDMAVDAAGTATMVGYTYSANYPVTPGAADTTYSAQWSDGVVARIDAQGSALAYATYLGGNGNDNPYAVALEPTGVAVVAGRTISGNFPVTPGAMNSVPTFGFVTRVASDGSSFVASTYFGGNNDGYLNDVAVGPLGRIYVAGWTRASDFPVTPGAYDTSFAGPAYDGIVSVLKPDLSGVVYSTYLGGAGFSPLEELSCVAVDESGVVTVAGQTGSSTYPVTPGADQTTFAMTIGTGVVSRFDPTLSQLLYSTYLGAATVGGPIGLNRINALARRNDGSVVVAGLTGMSNFPVTSSAVQPGHAGDYDAFAAVMQLSPVGALRFGEPSGTCSSTPWIGVNRQPQQGDSGFALTSSQAPQGAFGAAVVAAASVPAGLPLLGVTLYLDPNSPLLVLGALADPLGWCERTVPLPAGSQGLTVHGQFLWLDTSACAGNTISATNAISLTIQS